MARSVSPPGPLAQSLVPSTAEEAQDFAHATGRESRAFDMRALPELERSYELVVTPERVLDLVAGLRMAKLDKPLFVAQQHPGPTVAFRETGDHEFELAIRDDHVEAVCRGRVLATSEGSRVELSIVETPLTYARVRPWLRVAMAAASTYAVWQAFSAMILGRQFEFLLISLLLFSFATVYAGLLASPTGLGQGRFRVSLLEAVHNIFQPLSVGSSAGGPFRAQTALTG